MKNIVQVASFMQSLCKSFQIAFGINLAREFMGKNKQE